MVLTSTTGKPARLPLVIISSRPCSAAGCMVWFGLVWCVGGCMVDVCVWEGGWGGESMRMHEQSFGATPHPRQPTQTNTRHSILYQNATCPPNKHEAQHYQSANEALRTLVTPGMYSLGTTPPLMSLRNSKPVPGSPGSKRTATSANWPLPPLCFLCT